MLLQIQYPEFTANCAVIKYGLPLGKGFLSLIHFMFGHIVAQ